MEKIKLGKSGLLVPPIALGCMRLTGAERTQADAFLHTALELELNFFDHADIYGGGACERVFGEMIKDAGVRREDLIIQSKCAIVPGKMYDFSHSPCVLRRRPVDNSEDNRPHLWITLLKC